MAVGRQIPPEFALGASAGRVDRTTVARGSICAAALTLALLGSFAAFTAAFAPAGSPAVDHVASRFTAWAVRGPVDTLQEHIYLLGVPKVSLCLVGLLSLLVAVMRGWKAALLALGTLGLMAFFEGALRIRLAGLPWADPHALLGRRYVWHIVDGTYPSGHTARVLAIAGIAAFLLPRRSAVAGFGVAMLLGGLMAVQRIHAGQHSGSDVLGGFLLGAGMAAFFGALLPWATSCERSGSPSEKDGAS
jgi:membrane-associated phospholipid phosphatase